MRHLSLILLLIMMPVVCSSAFDLRKELGRKTFNESGLEKLTEEELVILNASVAKLLGNQEEVLHAEPELPQGEDLFGLETVKKRVQSLFQTDAPKFIESTLPGEFSGWKGNTRFKLENGQVWRQTDGDTFVIRTRTAPRVFIRRGALGSYLLKIEGYNSSCKVERVE